MVHVKAAASNSNFALGLVVLITVSLKWYTVVYEFLSASCRGATEEKKAGQTTIMSTMFKQVKFSIFRKGHSKK